MGRHLESNLADVLELGILHQQESLNSFQYPVGFSVSSTFCPVVLSDKLPCSKSGLELWKHRDELPMRFVLRIARGNLRTCMEVLYLAEHRKGNETKDIASFPPWEEKSLRECSGLCDLVSSPSEYILQGSSHAKDEELSVSAHRKLGKNIYFEIRFPS